MADEQYKWLDRDAAERLLRGEALETADADTRDQADRLAEVLGALTGEPTPTNDELPGEAAALAAFRKARTGGYGEQADVGRRARTRSAATSSPSSVSSVSSSSEADLIHLGRSPAGRRRLSRWARPVRYGLAAALAAGMIGGVSVAGTSGVLPFGGDEPESGSTATAAVTPDRPLLSPSPKETPDGGADAPTPDGGTGGQSGEGSSSRDEARGGTGPGKRPGSDGARPQKRSEQWWNGVTSACRDYRDGKNLDSGRRRNLEDAANGADMSKYCTAILGNGGGSGSADAREGQGTGQNGSSGQDGFGQDNTAKDGQGNDDEDGDSHHVRPGPGTHRGGDGKGHNGGGRADRTTFTPARPWATPAPAPAPASAPAPGPDANARPAESTSSSPA
ncbi:hypothetical protein [Streptomyces sp. 2A115]|uniref:hypothetical protein n=1 Tax=Streptomyces sp. 2A115 TaxID=3457439 RepID=UPI003FD3CA30